MPKLSTISARVSVDLKEKLIKMVDVEKTSESKFLIDLIEQAWVVYEPMVKNAERKKKAKDKATCGGT